VPEHTHTHMLQNAKHVCTHRRSSPRAAAASRGTVETHAHRDKWRWLESLVEVAHFSPLFTGRSAPITHTHTQASQPLQAGGGNPPVSGSQEAIVLQSHEAMRRNYTKSARLMSVIVCVCVCVCVCTQSFGGSIE